MSITVRCTACGEQVDLSKVAMPDVHFPSEVAIRKEIASRIGDALTIRAAFEDCVIVMGTIDALRLLCEIMELHPQSDDDKRHVKVLRGVADEMEAR